MITRAAIRGSLGQWSVPIFAARTVRFAAWVYRRSALKALKAKPRKAPKKK